MDVLNHSFKPMLETFPRILTTNHPLESFGLQFVLISIPNQPLSTLNIGKSGKSQVLGLLFFCFCFFFVMGIKFQFQLYKF